MGAFGVGRPKRVWWEQFGKVHGEALRPTQGFERREFEFFKWRKTYKETGKFERTHTFRDEDLV